MSEKTTQGERMKKLKKRLSQPSWWEFYKAISEWMPEFKLDEYDVHMNGNYEARCAFLNKWKYEKFKKFAKVYNKNKKMGVGRFFLLKLELAEITYKYDNMGKKTMQEALDVIKNM